jgi:hypothetical protein
VFVGRDGQDRAQEGIVLLEVLGECVPETFDALFGQDIVADGPVGAGEHGLGDLEHLVFVAGGRLLEGGLDLHGVLSVEELEGVVTLECRDADLFGLGGRRPELPPVHLALFLITSRAS